MNRLVGIVMGILVGAVATTSFADDKPAGEPADGSIKTDNVTVPVPADGYRWDKLQDIEHDGATLHIYVATKDGADAKVVFGFGMALPTEDQDRADLTFGFFDGIVKTLKKQGFADVSATRPRLRAPMPGRVAFTVVAKTPGGKPIVECGVVLFGKKGVYEFACLAGTEAEAKELLKCVEGMKELP